LGAESAQLVLTG